MAGYNADTMSWQVPETDTVYVDGLPQGITERDVEEYFGSIGVIKLDKKTRSKKIWLYRDKATGALKGDGTVSYEDPFSAGSAVEWFNDKEWKGVIGTAAVGVARQRINSSSWVAWHTDHCGGPAAVAAAAVSWRRQAVAQQRFFHFAIVRLECMRGCSGTPKPVACRAVYMLIERPPPPRTFNTLLKCVSCCPEDMLLGPDCSALTVCLYRSV